MQSMLNLEEIFQIKDLPSGAFMAIKADCLYKAGIITEREKRWVDSRVRAIFGYPRLKDTA